MFNSKLYIQGDQNVKIPAHLNFGKYMLHRLREMNNEVAVENHDTKETTTYREFLQQSIHIAVSLRKLGVKKRDVVAFGHEKCNIINVVCLGVIFTGATYTPYDLESGKSILKHKLSLVRPKYFILSESFWKLYSDVLNSIDSIETFITLDDAWECKKYPKFVTIGRLIEPIDTNLFEPVNVAGQTDIALVLYSSGTTGMPKAVQLSHLNCIMNILPTDLQRDEDLKTVFVNGLWYFNYDIFNTFNFLSAGRKIVYCNDVMSVTNILKCFEHLKVNVAMLVPKTINDITKAQLENYNLDSLKILYSRSSPLSKTTINNLKQRLPKLKNILQGYGMTECGEISTEIWANKGTRAGSVGMVSPGYTIKIVCSKTNKLQGPNEHGEIRVKSPSFMQGYMEVDPESYLDKEGFFKTGDMGYYDDDQYVFIVDRIKEIMNYTGFKIAPTELESIIQLHPAVLEVAVVGKPDAECGDLPTAFIVKRANCEVLAQDITDFLKDEVPPYMQLHGGVRFITKIPRNVRGKILRQELRDMLK